MVGSGFILLALLSGCPSDAAARRRPSGFRHQNNENENENSNNISSNTIHNNANNHNNLERNRVLKSKKESKKKSKDYYNYYAQTYYNYYGSAKTDKSCKASKGSKASKKDYYGYYDYECDETVTTAPMESPVDGNSTEVIDIDIEEDDVIVEITASSKSKKKKSKKTGKSAKSEKKEKSAKSEKKEKSTKSKKSKTKSEKKMKNKTSKSVKVDKKTLVPKSTSRPTPSPVARPDPIDEGYVPKESWRTAFNAAVGTGFLFYDPITDYTWYAYNADVERSDLPVSLLSAARTVDSNVFETQSATVEQGDASTMARVCPIETKNGKVLESLCFEIRPPEQWQTVTSSAIMSAEACYGGINGSVFKLAVIVQDTAKFMQFYDDLVGSRLIVYDIPLVGRDGAQAPIIAEVAYEGWESLYGDPTINGRPTFSPDCKTVYATWLTDGTVATETGGSDVIINLEPTSTTTVATNIEFRTEKGKTQELWRLGTNSRLAGLTPSKDGKTLYSAINVPEGDSSRSGGMVAVEASSGKILQQYAFPIEGGVPHSAYTNVILDDNGSTYHIDSLFGLVKFKGDDLEDGPIWSAVKSDNRRKEDSIMTRHLNPTRPRDKGNKDISISIVEEFFTAYKPALDASDYDTVYGCGGNAVGNEVDGVMALGTEGGRSVWFASFEDSHSSSKTEIEFFSNDKPVVVDIGSCSGITDDVRWAPSTAGGSNEGGIYISRGNKVQCLDSKNGTILWTYAATGEYDTSKFMVVSSETIVVANGGRVTVLQTKDTMPSDPPSMSAPSLQPTIQTKPTPSPVNTRPITNPPIEPQTSTPTASSAESARPSCYYIAVLSGLPLLLFLLR
eukprot:CAMPEP_0168194440 /NCGR_PEP_ID=MMETSP0139_2-20121125/19200_1 /TAXON_ID=44445 /ORGANISM="Pseudo-nitzschia australis, Strain 10249 10 AB" /LENGTH=845 /DNA_ID=CAMNT_0008117981 /DNA_START=244 /DNA_END=2781 /DNA_ORIENTATION=+